MAGVLDRFRNHRHNGNDCVMHDPDTLLMAKLASGAEEAFEELFNRNASPMYRMAAQFVGKQDAEDLVQEVFLRVFSVRYRWKPAAKFTTWLHKITVNLCLKHLRSMQAIEAMTLDASGESEQGVALRGMLTDGADDPERALLRKEFASAMQEAVNALPPNQRSAVVLHCFEGLAYKEIAAVLRCSVSAVESLLYRARQTLKRELESWKED